MSNPFAHQLQLNLNTGETKQVSATGVTTARQYFGSLTTLNESAHIYECVYLATPDALAYLEEPGRKTPQPPEPPKCRVCGTTEGLISYPQGPCCNGPECIAF